MTTSYRDLAWYPEPSGTDPSGTVGPDASPTGPTGPTGGAEWVAPRRGRLLERGTLAGLLAVAALLYLWDLGASGYANDFYAAAVQAGTKSWKAFFFGSLDANNVITVDKPPLSLWPMELAGRIFGFNSWSMLVPQAIEGVLAVWLLHATVTRWFGHWAGLLAGGLLAITPVAVLMFRFNNPDAAMLLLLVVAVYCVTRAIETASTTWLLLTGAAMGLDFLVKGLQPFTLLPALAIGYLVAAPTTLGRRILQVLLAGVAVVVAAGWWVLAVALTPAADRPYIGGSGNNSPLGLAFGYNGLSRLSSGSGSGPGGGVGFDGSTGITRLFNSLNGGQIAWLLPSALFAILGLAVVTRRAPRTDRARAALIVFGGWLLVTGIVLSYASGIIHTYYTSELAPAIAALVAIGAVVLWRARAEIVARAVLALGVAAAGITGYVLLQRTSGYYSWLALAVVLAGVAAAALVMARPGSAGRAVVATTLGLGIVALAGGSAAYTLTTVGTPHTGSTPTAGPASSSGFGAGGPGRGGFGGRPGGGFPGAGELPGGTAAGGTTAGGTTGGTAPTGTTTGGTTGATTPGGTAGTPSAGPGAGGPGGDSGSANSALVALLKKTTTEWAAAADGSMSAAPLQLASGKAVISIGGFSGSDPAPTLSQFEKWVAEGKIHYYIAGGGFGGGFGGGRGASGSSSNSISAWVAAHFASTTVGGTTVYDLTKQVS